MPSLHVGWNLLMGIAIFRCASTRWARAFGVLMPLAMYLATIVTANHYLLDGVVGSAVALVGLAIAGRLIRPAPVSALAPRPEGRAWNLGQASTSPTSLGPTHLIPSRPARAPGSPPHMSSRSPDVEPMPALALDLAPDPSSMQPRGNGAT